MSEPIFISHYHKDSMAHARHITSLLEWEFGREKVFIDDNLQGGDRYKQELDAALAACRVLVAVIGPNWETLEDDQGNRKLDNPNDLVRHEIRSALEAKKQIIPILIGGATLPDKAKLPEDIQDLVEVQFHTARDRGFDDDIRKLYPTIRRTVRGPWWKRPVTGAVAAGAVAVLAGVFVIAGLGDDDKTAAAKCSSARDLPAQTSGDPISQGDVSRVLQRYEAAYSQEDVNALRELFADNFERHHNNEATTKLQDSLNVYEEQFASQSPKYCYELKGEPIELTGDRAARVDTEYKIATSGGERAGSGDIEFQLGLDGHRLLIERLEIVAD